MKTKHNIDRKYGIAYCSILKKKGFLKNEKAANWKLRNLGNLGNLGNIITSFLISKFCPTAKIENSDLKILEKNLRVFRVFKVFDLAYSKPSSIYDEKLTDRVLNTPLGYIQEIIIRVQVTNCISKFLNTFF